MLDMPSGSLSRCLVTGANGFIGSALVEHLQAQGWRVRGALRQPCHAPGDWVQVASLDADTDWRQALQGCDVVVHTAARAHVLREQLDDPLTELRRVNVEGTLVLAEQALAVGVRRFVFISSIGVNGAVSAGAFRETDLPAPHSPYAQSKLEAEQGLRSLLRGQSMELVIVRPALVYAAHAPGNFARLLKLVSSGFPLPLASLDNRRSMIALSNLVSLLEVCLRHPSAAGELFLAADDGDVSTADLVRLLAQGMGRKAHLLPMPVGLLALGARLIGKQILYTQLCESLRVDISKARDVLGWQAPNDMHEALLESGRLYACRH
ncbi:NAD-dependent epimerase/dehydratase family protein [Pseudomonas sp. 1928-m]|uniref:NAD-dependent epimerase/dehydratase family protein n=1 Tax=Pseudomonas sp. 1928-m TaxID=3033804 RepID=UPI0023DF1465|nr:NAD-dependent epimerase/dehydratase family protein [Pseudomonas sp. 1928-m]MDF3194679.1 NAD-dependent epimerase/dehydratase family protein [Pseudomonas sp. 1928-m]